MLATLVVSGRLRPRPARAPPRPAGAGCSGSRWRSAAGRPARRPPGRDADALYAANQTVLAYVETGNARVDAVSAAGLNGLSRALFDRTAIEPAEPVAVDIETRRPLALPVPLLADHREPGAALGRGGGAAQRLPALRRHDPVRHPDADLGGALGRHHAERPGAAADRLRLDVPPLEPVPHDHVLTRTFYLLQDFPGRWANSPVWVEASPAPEEVEGMPFRNLNDGVTPVVIGGNDWAAAWAVQESGQPMFPVGRGIAGERQRELALRFGVNLIMYVMTGNYKSDQVHVPALLDRLGQ